MHTKRHIFNHSFILDISIAPLQIHYHSEALPTTALIMCRSQHPGVLQATVSEGLAQGPYLAAGEGFEPETHWTQGTELTTEPPHPTNIYTFIQKYALCATVISLFHVYSLVYEKVTPVSAVISDCVEE